MLSENAQSGNAVSLSEAQKTHLLKLAKESINETESKRSEIAKYINANKLNLEDVRKFGMDYYNENLGEDESRDGQALADRIRETQETYAREHKEAEEIEDAMTDDFDRNRGGKRSNKNKLSKRSKRSKRSNKNKKSRKFRK